MLNLGTILPVLALHGTSPFVPRMLKFPLVWIMTPFRLIHSSISSIKDDPHCHFYSCLPQKIKTYNKINVGMLSKENLNPICGAIEILDLFSVAPFKVIKSISEKE